jgi:sterol desaturase/sphingolipid hydroxylase (fatty acid hydroxylase superfamily)
MDFLRNISWKLWLPFAAIFTLIPFIINVLLAAGVADDAGELNRGGEQTRFVGPVVWALATVFGGVFVVLVYWVIHRSAFRRDSNHGSGQA